METLRMLFVIGLGVLAVTWTNAQPVTTDRPNTHVDRQNGVETSIPGTTIPQAAPDHKPSVIYNNGGNTVLQNGAGSIYTRPDGSKVLVGPNGQTIVTRGGGSDEDSDEDIAGGSGNVFINGGRVGGSSFISNNGNVLIMKTAGEGSYQTYNNYQSRIVNGGLQVTVDGKVYDFPAKDASVNTRENVDINGKQATVQYENGNIALELPDGTVLAKADGGLFSGDRNSYVNRKQIQEQTQRDLAQLERNLAEMSKNLQQQLHNQMEQLNKELAQTLGNLDFGL